MKKKIEFFKKKFRHKHWGMVFRVIGILLCLSYGWQLINGHVTLYHTLAGLVLWGMAVNLFLKFVPASDGIPIFSGTDLHHLKGKKEWPWMRIALMGAGILLVLKASDLLIHKKSWFLLFICLLVLGGCFYWLEKKSLVFWTASPGSANPGVGWVPWHVALVVLFGSLFLFYRLPEWPDFMWRDGALTLICGLNFYKGVYVTPFFTDWGENPAYTFMLVGLAFKVFGVSALVCASFFVVINIIGFVFFYGFARFYLPKESALVAALIYSTSRWIALYARTPHDGASIIIAFEAAALYFFARGLELGKPRDWALFGTILSFIQGVYLSSRVILAFFVASTIVLWLVRMKDMHRRKASWALGWGVCLFFFIPMAAWYFHNPDTLLGRIQEINIFSAMERTNNYNLIKTNAANTLQMFNVLGSYDHRFNLQGVPLISPWEGICLLVGLGWCFFRFYQPASLLLFVGFFGGLCSTILTMDAAHPMRTLVAAPFVYILVGIGIDRLSRLIAAPLSRRFRRARIFVLIGFLASAMWWNYDIFFNQFPKSKATWTLTEGPHVLAGKILAQYPKGWDYYLPTGYAFYDTEMFYIHGKGQMNYFKPEATLPLQTVPEKGAMVMLPNKMGDSFREWMHFYYPDSSPKPINDRFGDLQFWLWEITPEAIKKALELKETQPPGGALVRWYDEKGKKLGQYRIPSIYVSVYWFPDIWWPTDKIINYEISGLIDNPQGRGLGLDIIGKADLFLDGRKVLQTEGYTAERPFEVNPTPKGSIPFLIKYQRNSSHFYINLLWKGNEGWENIPSSALELSS